MATPESQVPVHTVLIWDNSGDPALVSLLAPRCAFGGCHRILRGPIVTYRGEMFHEGCWTTIARDRIRGAWNVTRSADHFDPYEDPGPHEEMAGGTPRDLLREFIQLRRAEPSDKSARRPEWEKLWTDLYRRAWFFFPEGVPEPDRKRP